MTRKRTRESLLHNLTEPCSACEGKGYTKSRRTVCYELFRELRRQGDLVEGDTILIEVHPEVANVLATTDRPFLDDIEKRLQKRIIVKARGSFHVEDFEIRSPNDKTPIEKSAVAGGARQGGARDPSGAAARSASGRPPRSRPCSPRKRPRASSTPRRWPTRRRPSRPRRPSRMGPRKRDE